jgi:predicted nucleotidyltransferase
MSGPADEQQIQLIQKLLESNPKILLAVVFGSVANGTAKPESDLDLGVAAAQTLTENERIELSQELGRAISREIDLIDFNSARGLIVSEALVNGRIILKRNPDVLARLMRQMWFDKADFGPLQSRIMARRRERAFGAVNSKKGAKDAG